MEYLKILRLDSKTSTLRFFIWIFFGFAIIILLLGAFINHFFEVLLVFSPLCLLFWLFIKFCKGDNVIFTDCEIYQTNLFKMKTRIIKHNEIAEIFAISTSVNILNTAIGSIGSMARPDVSYSRISFSNILSNKEYFGSNFIVISKTHITNIFPTALADNKNCILLNARKEVVELVIKLLPQYIAED